MPEGRRPKHRWQKRSERIPLQYQETDQAPQRWTYAGPRIAGSISGVDTQVAWNFPLPFVPPLPLPGPPATDRSDLGTRFDTVSFSDFSAKWSNFRGLVLGCIEAKFCNQILIFQHFSRFTRFAILRTAQISKFQQILQKKKLIFE